MRFEHCVDIDRSLWQYVDRELAAGDLALVSAHLKDCERCRELYHERAREANLYRTVLLGTQFGEGFVDKVRDRMQREGLLDGEWRQPRTRGVRPRGLTGAAVEDLDLQRPRLGRRLGRRVAVLAMVLLVPVAVVTGILLNGRESHLLGRFAAEGGPVEVSLQSDSRETSGWRMQGELAAGATLRVPEGRKALLRLEPAVADRLESTLTVAGPAELSIAPDNRRGQFSAVLASGSILATVAKRGPGETFQLLTPQGGHVSVVGTVFRLDVDVSRAVLRVLEGKVQFQARGTPGVLVTESDGAFSLEAGQSVPSPVPEVERAPAPGADAVSLPQAPPQPKEPTVPAVEPAPPQTVPGGQTLDAPVGGDEKPRSGER